MAKFTDNMTGWQKLILVFGGFILLLLALVFIPTETGNLLTRFQEVVGTIMESLTGGGG